MGVADGGGDPTATGSTGVCGLSQTVEQARTRRMARAAREGLITGRPTPRRALPLRRAALRRTQNSSVALEPNGPVGFRGGPETNQTEVRPLATGTMITRHQAGAAGPAGVAHRPARQRARRPPGSADDRRERCQLPGGSRASGRRGARLPAPDIRHDQHGHRRRHHHRRPALLRRIRRGGRGRRTTFGRSRPASCRGRGSAKRLSRLGSSPPSRHRRKRSESRNEVGIAVCLSAWWCSACRSPRSRGIPFLVVSRSGRFPERLQCTLELAPVGPGRRVSRPGRG